MLRRLPPGLALVVLASCQLDTPREHAGFQLAWLDELPVGEPFTQAEVQAWGLRHGFVAGCPSSPAGYEYDNACVGRGTCGSEKPIPFEDRVASLRFHFLYFSCRDALYLDSIELEAAIPDILALDGTRARPDVVARAARDAWGPLTARDGSGELWRRCDRFVRVQQRFSSLGNQQVEALRLVPRDDANREACVSVRDRRKSVRTR